MHKVVNTILEKEVSRREFLGLVGAGFLSLVGLTALLKNLENSFGLKQSNNVVNYGEQQYGGIVKSNNNSFNG